MSVVKIIEIISEGDSIENAVENGLKKASQSIDEIRNIYIQDIKAMVKDNKVDAYRLILKVSFVLQN